MSDVAQEQASALIQHFAEAASFVLSQVAGTALEAEPTLMDVPTDAATLIRLEISGSLNGLSEIALSAPMSMQFAAMLTGETPAPDANINSEVCEAAAELLQQICGNAADRLRRAFGPLELKSIPAREREAVTGSRHILRIARENDVLELELHIVNLSAPERTEARSTPQTIGKSAPQLSTAAAFPVSDLVPAAASRNLELLLDIELGASLRFGTRQMLLKDILELCSGSVVELDRRVQEPVELLIDGRIIAQGEVVIVEGNYGLRILQVATPGEKIACLP
jgi:flagellar motor switch protein FliN/FliY